MTATPVVVEIAFQALEPDEFTGQQWITCRAGSADPMIIGYIRPRGEGFEARGSGEGWPLIAVCADQTRALCTVISAWGKAVADSMETGEQVNS